MTAGIARRLRRLGAILALGSMLAMATACSDDDDATDSSGPTVPTAATESTATTSRETTEAPTSTEPAPTTTELNPVPTTPAPPSTTTATAVELPPVPTLVPQVPDELLTPEQRDPFNVNNSRPILPEHVPVIEAYLRAIQAFNFVASQNPINPDAPELLGAPFPPDGITENRDSLAARASAGQRLDVSQGVTHRPYVVGTVADTAVLVDCELAGHYWIDASGQRVDDPIWPAGPGRILEVGLTVQMVRRDGQWLWESSTIDTGGCP